MPRRGTGTKALHCLKLITYLPLSEVVKTRACYTYRDWVYSNGGLWLGGNKDVYTAS